MSDSIDYSKNPDWFLFDKFDEIIEILMNDPDGCRPMKIVSAICYQKNPSFLANFVFITRVHKCSH